MSQPAPAPTPAPSATPDDAVIAGVQATRQAGSAIATAVARRVVGQQAVVNALLTAVFARGHALLVGPPGTAKTLLVRTLAESLGWSFKRIQFTPDLMPSDITGTEVLREDRATGLREPAFVAGPVFANLVLADEINRATPKTQSALLEAMQERSVTVGGQTRALPAPFFVLATQNPVEQEGTYRLPEAQLDRFLVAIEVGYPSFDEEKAVALLDTANPAVVMPVLTADDHARLTAAVAALPVAPVAVDYAARLVRASRPTATSPAWVREDIAWGAGPRATQHLIAAARARAALMGVTAVTPAEVAQVAPLVLAHRLVPSFAAAGRGAVGSALLDRLLAEVKP
jgi:MoxR-like ATPase